MGEPWFCPLKVLCPLFFSRLKDLARRALGKVRAWNQLLDSAECWSASFLSLHAFLEQPRTIFSKSTSSWSSKDWNLSTMNDPAWSLPTPFFWSRLAGSCFYQCKIKEVGRQSVPWSGQARVQICQGWPELMRGAFILFIFQITWRPECLGSQPAASHPRSPVLLNMDLKSFRSVYCILLCSLWNALE